MSGISAWLLSVAGIVILSVLAELVLPEGQVNRYIKVIFSFVIILVIVSPLPKLFGKDYNFGNLFNNSSSSQLQENYLYQLNIDKLNAITEGLSDKVKKEGLKNVEISINANVLSEKLEIFGVFVNLENLSFDTDSQCKDKASAKIVIRKIIDETLENVEVKFNE